MRLLRLALLLALTTGLPSCSGVEPFRADAITVSSPLSKTDLYTRVDSALAAEGWGVASSDVALGIVTTEYRPEGSASVRLIVAVEQANSGSTATVRGQLNTLGSLGATTPVRQAGTPASPMRRAWQAMEQVAARLR